MKIVASDKSLPELTEYLAPFTKYFVRSEGRNILEGYSPGLLSDIKKKNGTAIAEATPGTTNQRLQSLLTTIQWDENTFNTKLNQVQRLRNGVGLGNSVLIVDDTGFPTQGHCSVGAAPLVLWGAWQSGQLPSMSHLPLRR